MAFSNTKTPAESKRVSFLSVFSSIMSARPNINTAEIKEVVQQAFGIVDELWEKFKDDPIPVYQSAAATPFPSQGDSKCPKCGKDMKLVPAGFSKKKNKSYGAFYSCDKQAGGCGFSQSLPTGPNNS